MPPPNDEKTPKTTCQKQKSAFVFPKKAAAPPKVAQKKSAPAPTCLPTYRLPVAVSFFGCSLVTCMKTTLAHKKTIEERWWKDAARGAQTPPRTGEFFRRPHWPSRTSGAVRPTTNFRGFRREKKSNHHLGTCVDKTTHAQEWLLEQAATSAAFKNHLLPRGTKLESRGTQRQTTRRIDSLGLGWQETTYNGSRALRTYLGIRVAYHAEDDPQISNAVEVAA